MISTDDSIELQASVPCYNEIDHSNQCDLCEKSLRIFAIGSPKRQLLIRMCTSGSKCDTFVLVMIILNAVSMACVDYRHVDNNYEPISEGSLTNSVVEKAENIFMFIFILECIIKILAFGFICGERAYLRSAWNIFDFLIVLCSLLSIIPVFPNLSALRSLRVLRPLKSISKLPGLRKIISALMDSANDLFNVMLLLAFLIFCFSLLGILFWNGLLHTRCRLTPFPVQMKENCTLVGEPCWQEFIQEVMIHPYDYKCLPDVNDDPSWTQSTSPWFLKQTEKCIWPIDNNDERICSLSSIGNYHCPPLYLPGDDDPILRTCGSNYDAFGNPRFPNHLEPYGFERMKSGTYIESLNWGFTNFDNFGAAFLTTFQVITLEGWTNVMQQVVDVWYYTPTVFIFTIEVILCGYIVLNLVLAVISKSLEQIEDEEKKEDDSYMSELLSSSSINSNSGKLLLFVEGKCHSIFLMICILLNTIVLSLDYYGISEDKASLLEIFNATFTLVFFGDVVICNLAYGPRKYWRYVLGDYNMCFDGLIGIISLVEIAIMYVFPTENAGASSFSVFRSLRLFRVFKMAKNWKSLHSLLQTMFSSVKEIGNFATLLFLFIFIYSLIGIQLLSNRLHFSPMSGSTIGINEEGYDTADVPRSHFDSFFWSFVTVFQILTGENWNTVMYDGWRTRGNIAVVYMLSLLVIGVFIVMNLFLAILLKKFEENEEFVDSVKLEKKLKSANDVSEAAKPKRPSVIQLLGAKLGKDNFFRKLCFRLVESSYFEIGVTSLIVGSSLCLAMDCPLLDPQSLRTRFLHYCDIVFTILFIIEMIVKILAYGLILERGAYLRNCWNVLDFVTLLISILNLLDIGPGSSLRALRTLRVLRPLRMVNRLPELKVVVDALLLSFPSVGDVAVLCALFFLIFSSFGVNFLKGTFYHCGGNVFNSLPAEQLKYITRPTEWGKTSAIQKSWFDVAIEGCMVGSWIESTVPTSKAVCDCLAPGEWKLVIPQNFDNVMNGMALLFEIATTEGWVDVMYAAIDQRGTEMQPIRDTNPLWALFFIAFLIIGAFFVLELFVGVTIDNFNKIKEKTGRTIMTDTQKQWAATQSFTMKIKPERRILQPSGTLRHKCFDFVISSSFQQFITICIIFSSFLAAVVTFGDSSAKTNILEASNSSLSIIFTIELVLKIYALRMRYFDDGWNKFEFMVVFSSNLFIVIGFFVSQTGPTISSVIRLLRICRLFRLIKRLKKLRMLFNTLIVSIPSIVNIGSLMILLFFIYAVIGMQLFSFIPNNDEVNEHANFRTFGSAMLLLLRFSTGENWNGFMRSIVQSESDCLKYPEYNPNAPWCLTGDDYPNCTEINGCGAGFSAFIYFYSFTMLVSFVVLNLFVGIVLQAFENSNEGDILNPDDLNHFTKCWAQFDPTATWHIKTSDIKPFLVKLGAPLGVESHDFSALDRIMKDECIRELPVNQNSQVNIVHVATQLAKRLTKMKQGEEFHELADDHPIQLKMTSTTSDMKKTLNEVYVERSRKKLRILRAFVKAKIKPEVLISPAENT